MELIRRLRYFGYLEKIGITEREPGEVFEKLIDHLAATHDWTHVRTATSRGSDPVAAKKKLTKTAGKVRKSKTAPPEPDEILAEPVKLHYLIDRRDFLEKAKSVYASYA
jgi:hypothetical protein